MPLTYVKAVFCYEYGKTISKNRKDKKKNLKFM